MGTDTARAEEIAVPMFLLENFAAHSDAPVRPQSRVKRTRRGNRLTGTIDPKRTSHGEVNNFVGPRGDAAMPILLTRRDRHRIRLKFQGQKPGTEKSSFSKRPRPTEEAALKGVEWLMKRAK